MTRIHLSPPDVGAEERAMLLDAFDSNWIAPLGPHVDAFEEEFAATVGVQGAAALASGTAGLHLGLRLLGVQPGDDVLVSTLTFIASVNAITYVGARPVLVDCDPGTWQMDPDLVAEELHARAKTGHLPAAVLVVDLYGQCADHDRLLDTCRWYGVPVLEDAAEALGASYRGKPAGACGDVGIFSFNGNKIITTSGGGMLVSDEPQLVQRARFLASQAREAHRHYEHQTVGYNYRLSNLLAAVGRAQLRSLPAKVERRRRTNAAYRAALSDVPGVDFMPEADYGRSNGWLTCLTLDSESFGASRDAVLDHMEASDIEARPVWKPMHLQPVYRDAPYVGGLVSDDLYRRGLCLPSGSNLTADDRERVVENLLAGARRGRVSA